MCGFRTRCSFVWKKKNQSERVCACGCDVGNGGPTMMEKQAGRITITQLLLHQRGVEVMATNKPSSLPILPSKQVDRFSLFCHKGSSGKVDNVPVARLLMLPCCQMLQIAGKTSAAAVQKTCINSKRL